MPLSKHHIILTGLWLLTVLVHSCSLQNTEPEGHYGTWKYYRGDPGSNAYSSLDQINTQNVNQLEVAWIYRTGDSRSGSSIQCNPLVINNVLYGTTPGLKVFALDAATGTELWEYDPSGGDPDSSIGGTNRGLAYWEHGGDSRLFYCVGNDLRALDTATGTLVEDFGTEGSVDLRMDLDLDGFRESMYITNTSPGIVFEDLLILGSSVLEAHASLPGHIRAYDVRTGKLRWVFHTIPHPGEFGYDTWPEDYYLHGGGANAWGGMSLDYNRGIVYIPLGSATHDFYGADRHGQGLFANCILALDAATGAYRWHFQVSHHDLWDYDLPTAPNLVSIEVNGSRKDVVVQLTKQGLVFVLDRETGAPVFEVVERQVPSSSVPGEMAWPTQPFPTKPEPLVRQSYTRDIISRITPESTESIEQQIAEYTLGGIYTPPSLSGIIQLPGFRGGSEWSGGAVDPESGYIYVGLNDIPNMVKLIELQDTGSTVRQENVLKHGEQVYQINCALCHGADRKGSVQYPSLVSVEKHLTVNEAEDLLNTGRGMMPSFSALPEHDRKSVLAYLYHMDQEQVREFVKVMDTVGVETQTQRLPQQYRLKAYQQLRDHLGYPGIEPPWGMLCALDLNAGEVSWKVPLGEYQELTSLGVPVTGTQLFGGGVVTAGGLIFIGASRDEKFRAFDKDNGNILWEFQLPAGGYATPATYEVNNQQYVVIAAGGGGMQGTPSGDYYYAFRLPKQPGN